MIKVVQSEIGGGKVSFSLHIATGRFWMDKSMARHRKTVEAFVI